MRSIMLMLLLSVSIQAKVIYGAAVTGATVRLSTGQSTVCVAPSGDYNFTVANNWTGTITATLADYVFYPKTTAGRVDAFGDLLANFDVDSVRVWGYAKYDDGKVIPGVKVQAAPTLIDTTDAAGYYTLIVGVRDVTTYLTGSKPYTPINTPTVLVDQDYPKQYDFSCSKIVIMGTVRDSAGATPTGVMIWFGTTDWRLSNGSFACTLSYNWSGTVTATKAGYINDSRTCTNLKDNAEINLVLQTRYITISGHVFDTAGVPLDSVRIAGGLGTVWYYTNIDGDYTQLVPYNWSGVISANSGYNRQEVTFTNLVRDTVYNFYLLPEPATSTIAKTVRITRPATVKPAYDLLGRTIRTGRPVGMQILRANHCTKQVLVK